MIEPLRVAYLISQYPASSHTFIRREIESLRRDGAMIETFSIRRPAPAELVAEADRAAACETWFLLPISPLKLVAAHAVALLRRPAAYFRTLGLAFSHRAPGLRALLWSLFHFAEAVVLAQEWRNRGVTHVHNHFANAGATIGLLATHLLDLPWSLTLHGISETDYPAGLTLRQKIAAAEYVACISWFGRAQAMRLAAPADWCKLHIVRCGLDLADERLSFRAAARGNARARIICVARLSPEKGHIGLLDAFSQLIADDHDAELVLIGDGPMLAAIKQRTHTLNIVDRVILLGRLDEGATLTEIARSDLLVLPSFMEGLPIVLMEAMALGVPVVASRVAGIPELIADEVEGLLFTPSDWTDLATMMQRLLHDQALRNRFAQAARLKIEQEFSIRTTTLSLLDRFKPANNPTL